MQKTRAQNIEFWPNSGHFRDDRSEGKISEIFLKIRFLGRFPNLFEFFFDFGYLDIAFNACIKEMESNTPKCDFNNSMVSA